MDTILEILETIKPGAVLSHNKVALLHKVIEIRRIMDKRTNPKKS